MADPREIAIVACKNCRFLYPDKRPEYVAYGHCRAGPPQLVAWSMVDGYGQREGVVEQHWPWMQPDDWCGCFQAKVTLDALKGQGNG